MSKKVDIEELIRRSSIGQALEDIRIRGIDAHLEDFEHGARASVTARRRRRRRRPHLSMFSLLAVRLDRYEVLLWGRSAVVTMERKPCLAT